MSSTTNHYSVLIQKNINKRVLCKLAFLSICLTSIKNKKNYDVLQNIIMLNHFLILKKKKKKKRVEVTVYML